MLSPVSPYRESPRFRVLEILTVIYTIWSYKNYEKKVISFISRNRKLSFKKLTSQTNKNKNKNSMSHIFNGKAWVKSYSICLFVFLILEGAHVRKKVMLFKGWELNQFRTSHGFSKFGLWHYFEESYIVLCQYLGLSVEYLTLPGTK